MIRDESIRRTSRTSSRRQRQTRRVRPHFKVTIDESRLLSCHILYQHPIPIQMRQAMEHDILHALQRPIQTTMGTTNSTIRHSRPRLVSTTRTLCRYMLHICHILPCTRVFPMKSTSKQNDRCLSTMCLQDGIRRSRPSAHSSLHHQRRCFPPTQAMSSHIRTTSLTQSSTSQWMASAKNLWTSTSSTSPTHLRRNPHLNHSNPRPH